MSNNEIVKIDIAKVVKNKAPNAKVPKFIINYLRRIVHEDELNFILQSNPDLKNLDLIEAGLKYLNVKINIEGKENLPPKGGKYIFTSNHPLGGLDGVSTGYLIGKEYDGKVRFFSNDLLMYVPPLHEMFIPVNKTGSQGKEHAEMMLDLYKSDNHLITYPAGICSRKIKGKIVDLEWKKNFINKAIEYERDVVPIYFEGKNSIFFYNLANLRKFLGIKFNIEMMYLADEMFKQKGKSFKIRIGKPIPWQTFDKSKTQREWAQWVKAKVYDMA
jgi:putative hemolysin